MPRSFDYAATKTKRYDERLRMPKFPFNAARARGGDDVRARPDERAAGRRSTSTSPGPRQEAIVQGRHVLDKYNCAGCHMLDMERWEIAFEPD